MNWKMNQSSWNLYQIYFIILNVNPSYEDCPVFSTETDIARIS